MFVTAKVFFENGTANNTRLLIRMENTIPADFLKLYKKNVVVLTPSSGKGALRKSIITQQVGNVANIGWRSDYARAQNEGGHTDKTKHFVPAIGYGRNGKGYMAMPGAEHRYNKYTESGTGPRFASLAFKQTKEDMIPMMREEGFTK